MFNDDFIFNRDLLFDSPDIKASKLSLEQAQIERKKRKKKKKGRERIHALARVEPR